MKLAVRGGPIGPGPRRRGSCARVRLRQEAARGQRDVGPGPAGWWFVSVTS